MMAVAVLILSIFTALNFAGHKVQAQSVTFSSGRDCNNNAVIFCGAMNTDELLQKFDADSSINAIYMAFNITPQNIIDMKTTAVAGQVTSGSNVFVAGKEVATNAITAGRENIAGSTMVTNDGVTFFKRPPSVSFVSSPLDAFVVMNNGQFMFAILASCGNPVVATPIQPVTPPPAPAPTPIPTPVTPVAAPQPTPPPPAPTPLPKTGAGMSTALIFFGVAIGSATVHYIITARRLHLSAALSVEPAQLSSS